MRLRPVTVTERIRRYISNGVFSDEEIASIMKVKLTRVQQIRWLMAHPSYARDKMREYRGRNVG